MNAKPFSIQSLPFMPGLELNRRFHRELVMPLVESYDPGLVYSAALMGYGSDVLGYDNATSMDHNWGPRGQLFLAAEDAERIAPLRAFLEEHLPAEFLGFPVNFSGKRSDGTQCMQPIDGGRVNTLIEIHDIDRYFADALHADPDRMQPLDWLRLPEQRLLELTAGEVFHDGLYRLNPIRERLHYYPRDIRLLKLAAYWNCIANEEAFIGRSVEMGDLIGLKLITTRQVNTLLKMCFVLQGRYLTYSKWFSRAFSKLGLPGIRQSALKILSSNNPGDIEQRVADLSMQVLAEHNRHDDLPKIEATITSFYNRPYKVLMADHIAEILHGDIGDEALRRLDLNEAGLDNRIDGLDLSENDTLAKIFSSDG